MSLNGLTLAVLKRDQLSTGTAGMSYQQRFRSVRFVRYGAQELAPASERLLFGALGDINQRIRGNLPMRRWRRNKSAGNVVSYHKSSGFLVSPR